MSSTTKNRLYYFVMNITDKKNILILHKDDKIASLITKELNGLHSVQKIEITHEDPTLISEVALLLSSLKYDCLLNLIYFQRHEKISDNKYSWSKFLSLLPSSSVGKSTVIVNAFSGNDPRMPPTRFASLLAEDDEGLFRPAVTNLFCGSLLDRAPNIYTDEVLAALHGRKALNLREAKPLWLFSEKWAAKILARVIVQLAAFPQLTDNYTVAATGAPDEGDFYFKARELSEKLFPNVTCAPLKLRKFAERPEPDTAALREFEKAFDISLPYWTDIADEVLVSRLFAKK